MRILAVVVMVIGDFVAPALGDTEAGWLFVVLGVLGGLIIARWWAPSIAVTLLLVSLTVSPGHDDTQGSIVFLVGVLGGIAQAFLIAVGVATAKSIRPLRRQWMRRSHARH